MIHAMNNMRNNGTFSFEAMDLGSASTHDDINIIIVLLLNRVVLIIVIISRFR